MQPPNGNDGGSYPDRMRVARVPIASDAKARNIYGPVYVGALMVAAGKKGKDACDGDSGGPVFATLAGKRYQVGITSFGRGRGARGYPGVYTEVSAGAIRTFSCTPPASDGATALLRETMGRVGYGLCHP